MTETAQQRMDRRAKGLLPAGGGGLVVLTDAEIKDLVPLLEAQSGKKFKSIDAARTALQDTKYRGLNSTGIASKITADTIAGGGLDKYGTTVNKQTNKYDPDVLNALVDQTYQATLGRNATDDEKKLRLDEINKQIAMGTKTTTTTFKGGSTTSVEPGFSQDRAGLEIAAKAKAEAPGDLETMNQINFHDFILKNMGA
jgi:hypothetical protein